MLLTGCRLVVTAIDTESGIIRALMNTLLRVVRLRRLYARRRTGIERHCCALLLMSSAVATCHVDDYDE